MNSKQMNRTGNIQRKKKKWRSKSQNHTAPKNGKNTTGKKPTTANSGEYFSHLAILRFKKHFDDAIPLYLLTNINVTLSFGTCCLLNTCVYFIRLITQASVSLSSISVRLHADVYNGPRLTKCLLDPLGSHLQKEEKEMCIIPIWRFHSAYMKREMCLCVRARKRLSSSSLED